MPDAASNSCRRCNSPPSASRNRSTRLRSASRLVIMPATCGSSARPENVAPPLKSASSRASVAGGWVIANAVTRLRNSSDLPEPVAPTTRPCGPIPPRADSFRSSTSGVPSAAMPIGTRSSSPPGRGRQLTAGSSAATSPSRHGSTARGSSGCLPGNAAGSAGERSGEQHRAGRVQLVEPAAHEHRRPIRCNPLRPAATERPFRPARPSVSVPAASSPAVRLVGIKHSATAPTAFAAAASADRSGVHPDSPSMTTTVRRPGSTPAGPPHRACSASRSVARSGPSVISRTGSGPSRPWSARVCGSHLSQSQVSDPSPQTSTATSAGLCAQINCASSARVTETTRAGSPTTVSAVAAASGTQIG